MATEISQNLRPWANWEDHVPRLEYVNQAVSHPRFCFDTQTEVKQLLEEGYTGTEIGKKLRDRDFGIIEVGLALMSFGFNVLIIGLSNEQRAQWDFPSSTKSLHVSEFPDESVFVPIPWLWANPRVIWVRGFEEYEVDEFARGAVAS